MTFILVVNVHKAFYHNYLQVLYLRNTLHSSLGLCRTMMSLRSGQEFQKKETRSN